MFQNSTLGALVNNHLGDYPTPKTITYFGGFGSLAGVFLAVQIITGLLLSFHYAPHVSIAFNAMEHIMRDVNYGGLIRFCHCNGASFFFIAVYTHIGRAFFYNSFLLPRLVAGNVRSLYFFTPVFFIIPIIPIGPGDSELFKELAASQNELAAMINAGNSFFADPEVSQLLFFRDEYASRSKSISIGHNQRIEVLYHDAVSLYASERTPPEFPGTTGDNPAELLITSALRHLDYNLYSEHLFNPCRFNGHVTPKGLLIAEQKGVVLSEARFNAARDRLPLIERLRLFHSLLFIKEGHEEYKVRYDSLYDQGHIRKAGSMQADLAKSQELSWKLYFKVKDQNHMVEAAKIKHLIISYYTDYGFDAAKTGPSLKIRPLVDHLNENQVAQVRAESLLDGQRSSSPHPDEFAADHVARVPAAGFNNPVADVAPPAIPNPSPHCFSFKPTNLVFDKYGGKDTNYYHLTNFHGLFYSPHSPHFYFPKPRGSNENSSNSSINSVDESFLWQFDLDALIVVFSVILCSCFLFITVKTFVGSKNLNKSFLYRIFFFIFYNYFFIYEKGQKRKLRKKRKSGFVSFGRRLFAFMFGKKKRSFHIFIGRPSKAENERIAKQFIELEKLFKIGAFEEIRDLQFENLLLPNKNTLVSMFSGAKDRLQNLLDAKRQDVFEYRSMLRLKGFSEEKIVELTTVFMIDGQSYLLSDSETPTRQLTAAQIVERDQMRSVLQHFERSETQYLKKIRHSIINSADEFDPRLLPYIPVWRYNPAIGENPYASFVSIENEFQDRYYELNLSYVFRVHERGALKAWLWGGIIFFAFIVQLFGNVPIAPGAAIDTNGHLIVKFCQPVSDMGVDIWEPELIGGYNPKDKLWVPGYLHFCGPDPYFHHLWDVQLPEVLHPLDGVLYSNLVDRKGVGIVNYDFSFVYPTAPLVGNEGLFTYDLDTYTDEFSKVCGSGGLAETIGSVPSYGPWFDPFSEILFDPCVDDYYNFFKIKLLPKGLIVKSSILAGYDGSFYRRSVTFFAKNIHWGLFIKGRGDSQIILFDHVLTLFFGWPLFFYTCGANVRVGITDYETFKVYGGGKFRSSILGEDLGPGDNRWYVKEVVRLRVLYMHKDWGYHMRYVWVPKFFLEGTDYPTDYANDPRFSSEELAMFMSQVGVFFDDYEIILSEVLAEEEEKYKEGKETFLKENAAWLASVAKRDADLLAEKLMIVSLQEKSPAAAANFLTQKRRLYYYTYMSFFPTESEVDIYKAVLSDPELIVRKEKTVDLLFSLESLYFVDTHMSIGISIDFASIPFKRIFMILFRIFKILLKGFIAFLFVYHGGDFFLTWLYS